MIKLYLIEEQGRTLKKKSLEVLLRCCCEHFEKEEINFAGGYSYLATEKLLKEIKDDLKREIFSEVAIAFIYEEGKKLFICAELDIDKFLELAKSSSEQNSVNIIKKII